MNIRRQHIMMFVLIIIILGFVLLTVLVHLYPASGVDLMFSKEVQEHQNKLADETMYLVSYPGYMPQAVVMIIITSILLFIFKYKKAAVYILFTMLSGLVSTVFKALINRPRPSDTLVRIVYKTTQQSFPSGHVLFYIVFFGFLIVLMLQLENIINIVRIIVIICSLLMIFLIPISRIYLGAHWFTDVLGGFLSGLICLYLLTWSYLRKRAGKEEAPAAEVK